MPVEQFRGYLAAIVAAVCVIGGAAGMVYLWALPPIGPPRDLTLIYGVLGGLVGSGTTFLFVQEGASRATNAAERSFNSGASIGGTLPEQITGAAERGTITTSTATVPNPPDPLDPDAP